jgi:hypothetical protein
MSQRSQAQMNDTKRIMAALGKMPPKPHSEMKLGKLKAKAEGSPPTKRRAASAKLKTA